MGFVAQPADARLWRRVLVGWERRREAEERVRPHELRILSLVQRKTQRQRRYSPPTLAMRLVGAQSRRVRPALAAGLVAFVTRYRRGIPPPLERAERAWP